VGVWLWVRTVVTVYHPCDSWLSPVLGACVSVFSLGPLFLFYTCLPLRGSVRAGWRPVRAASSRGISASTRLVVTPNLLEVPVSSAF